MSLVILLNCWFSSLLNDLSLLFRNSVVGWTIWIMCYLALVLSYTDYLRFILSFLSLPCSVSSKIDSTHSLSPPFRPIRGSADWLVSFTSISSSWKRSSRWTGIIEKQLITAVCVASRVLTLHPPVDRWTPHSAREADIFYNWFLPMYSSAEKPVSKQNNGNWSGTGGFYTPLLRLGWRILCLTGLELDGRRIERGFRLFFTKGRLFLTEQGLLYYGMSKTVLLNKSETEIDIRFMVLLLHGPNYKLSLINLHSLSPKSKPLSKTSSSAFASSSALLPPVSSVSSWIFIIFA